MKQKAPFYTLLLCCALGVFACQNSSKSNAGWEFSSMIPLDTLGVIGIAPAENDHLWLADADNNQLLQIDQGGNVLFSIGGLDRPMHISKRNDVLLVAEYGADRIRLIKPGVKDTLPFQNAFDAPSGVDRENGKTAVADFYNHRVVLSDGKKEQVLGGKGSQAGQMTYPTDVQFAHGKLWVADAYNHRVQVFSLTGKHLQTIGESEKMNATTGLFVGPEQVFVTDFENSRLLIYDLDGKLKGIIAENLDKPTEALQIGNQLYVVNYQGHYLSVFERETKK
jgi:NHL repeat